MPNIDIVRTSEVADTYRASKIAADFDFNEREIIERFSLTFDFPKEWNVGLIVGNSGTGKTTIAHELFDNDCFLRFEYSELGVINDMPDHKSVNDITKAFYATGFGSVPSWLKPYSVLSVGEKMRVDLARAMLERDFFVFDEFTSTVDRNVAKTLSMAIEKSVRTSKKKFVAVSCHKDIIEYLQPDWIIDTDVMQCFFPSTRAQSESLSSRSAGTANGRSLESITI